MLRAKASVLVTRRDRLSGAFFPQPEITLPIELKRELFVVLSADGTRRLPTLTTNHSYESISPVLRAVLFLPLFQEWRCCVD
jgi:hypothetical protein